MKKLYLFIFSLLSIDFSILFILELSNFNDYYIKRVGLGFILLFVIIFQILFYRNERKGGK